MTHFSPLSIKFAIHFLLKRKDLREIPALLKGPEASLKTWQEKRRNRQEYRHNTEHFLKDHPYSRNKEKFGPISADSFFQNLVSTEHMPQISAKKERRKSDRLPLAVPLFMRAKGENDKDLLEFVSAVNMSGGGALVAARRFFPLFSQVSVEIPAAPVASSKAFPHVIRTLPAQVVRVSHAEGYHLMALKFAHAIGPRASRHQPPRRKSASAV